MNYRYKKYIGIDLHTNNFTAYYINTRGQTYSEIFKLDHEDFKRFIKTLKKYDEIALETVSNADYFKSVVGKYVKKVIVVPSSNFAIIAKSVKKTDKNDAYLLAYFLTKRMLPEARLRSIPAKTILSLGGLRALLISKKVSLINRVHGKLVENGVKASKNVFNKDGFERYVWSHNWDEHIKYEFEVLECHIRALQESINKLTEKIISLAKKNLKGFDNVLQIKGIGELSCALLLAYIDDINDFANANKLTAYFGVVPTTRISNKKSQKKSLTKKSNTNIRAILRLSAFTAVRTDPYMADFYARIKKNTGVSSKAYAACRRKIVILLYHLLKNDISYEEFKSARA